MFYFGVDYYPEHWPEERWSEDARLMAEARVNVVRMAEFAWSKLEPQDGTFCFDWLDRAIAILDVHGIKTVLGTPTASPPPWLMAKSEELFLVREDGVRLTYGLRREYCPNNPRYHQYTERIVTKMAEHYRNHPSVMGWQIDNEFGNRCFCDICKAAFHEWLRERYRSLDNLNGKWGTIFWSHVYTEWSQIPVPQTTNDDNTTVYHNPGLNLDYYRYVSDSYVSYQKQQIDVLLKLCPEHFITHNLMGFRYPLLNYFDLSEDIDFVSWDNYVRTMWNMQADYDPSSAALSADTMRGLKNKNIWVMEQQSGGGGWNMAAVPPKPGELRLWTYQSIGRGADGIVYFRWRTCRYGTEQFWQGILEHHGIPGRRYAETSQAGHELQKIGDLITGSTVKAQVAIMQSYDSRFAFQIQPNNPQFGYERHLHDFYKGFFDHNIVVDIISENDPLENYKVIVVPAMYVLPEKTAANLDAFASAGGIVIFSPRTGVKDDYNAVVNMKLPGLVAKMCGVEVEEYISMPTDSDNAVQFGIPELEEEFTTSIWADVLDPIEAKVIGRFTGDYYADKPAATINVYGDGKVIYLGAMGDVDYYSSIARWVSGLARIDPLLETPIGVEVAERWQGDQRLLFVLNHTRQTESIFLEGHYVDLLTGDQLIDEFNIPPTEVMILTPAQENV
ncbi:MAG: beta-galactosidase [Candidatus Promineifilaceae bacterium]